MRHETTVKQWTKKATDEHLAESKIALVERFTYDGENYNEESVAVRYKSLQETFADGPAWEATCLCGWTANNPVPSEEAANESADYHMATMYPESG
jgi:hypothetical protein